jgi:uncharacterized protein YkwD
MGNKQTGLKSSPSKGNIKAPGYLASVLPFLEPGDGVTELEAYLRANPDQQLNVAQQLANQSTDAQFRRNVVTLGALRILRLLTISDEHNVKLCAVHALGNLAVDKGNHDDMVSDGCFYNIIDLLSSGKVDLQRKSARAITNLCVTNDNKHHFDGLGAIGALIHLAQHKDEKCRTEAVAALGNLAVDDALEIKIGQQGGIEAVHACLVNSGGDRALQEHAQRAIRNLTTSEQNKQYYAALQKHEPQQMPKKMSVGSSVSHSQHLSRDIAASVGNWFEGREENVTVVDNSDSSDDSDDDQPVLMTRGGNVPSTSTYPPAPQTTPTSSLPSIPPPNQSGWRQLMDPNSQQPYWYNVHTQESRWTPPSLVAPRPPAASTPVSTPTTASFAPAHPTSKLKQQPLAVSVPPPASSPPMSTTASTMSPKQINEILAGLPAAMSPRSAVRRGHGRAGTIVAVSPKQQQQQSPPSPSRHERALTIAPPSHDHDPAPPTVHIARPPSVSPPPIFNKSPSVPPPRVPEGLPPAATTPTSNSPTKTQLPSRPQTVALPSEPHPEDRLSLISKQIVDAINMARTNPSLFINRLAETKKMVDGNNILRSKVGSVQTSEGTKAYDEAITFLSHMKPMSPLEISTPMCEANQSHADDLGQSGKTGHVGSDGSRAAQRLRKHGGVIAGGGRVSEGIEFGPWTDGSDFVVSLIVGDGEESRTQRKILMDTSSNACGVAVSTHKKFGSVCVVTLAPNCSKIDHQRKNTMQLAQSMSLPSILETAETNEHQGNVRRNTIHTAANVPIAFN